MALKEMTNDKYAQIWVAGTTDGIEEFLSGMVSRLEEMRGASCVKRVSQTQMNISWKLSIFVEFSDSKVNFKIPVELDGKIDISEWNNILRQFNEVIIEPLKAQTGGVATIFL